MSRLTEQKYWEGTYRGDAPTSAPKAERAGLKQSLKKLLPTRLLDLIGAYDDHLLWDVVLPGFLPKDRANLDVIEIGSAPGNFLVRFAKTFGSRVHGVEYSRSGAERNRRNFAENDLDPKNVIEADFFSPEFLDSRKGAFDVVISRGFIEHFTDVEPVVARHLDLLRPGGLLVVLIPNLRGVYGAWTKAFNPEQMPIHNLEIMELSRFRRLFEDPRVAPLMCGYFGAFSFWLFTAPQEAAWTNRFIRVLIFLQNGLNLAFRLLLGNGRGETAAFSPALIFVGRRAAGSPA